MGDRGSHENDISDVYSRGLWQRHSAWPEFPGNTMSYQHAKRAAPCYLLHTFSTLAAVLVLSACSGSDSVSNTPVATVSGPVVGSFIENARVRMDGNKNSQCDSSEIEVRSARDGSSTLPVVVGADLLADVGTDAFMAEKADFSDRKPALARFILRSANAVWNQGSTSISALTTMVSTDVDSGTSQNAAS